MAIHQFPNGGGAPKPEDDRFWATALELGVALAPHQGFGDQLPPPVPPGVGTQMRTMAGALIDRIGSLRPAYCLAQLICAGVFDRFPGLQFYFAETNAAWLASALYHYDDTWRCYNEWFRLDLPRLPSEYIREHVYFGMIRDPVALQLGDHVPLDRLMWGADFPHSVGTYPRLAPVHQRRLRAPRRRRASPHPRRQPGKVLRSRPRGRAHPDAGPVNRPPTSMTTSLTTSLTTPSPSVPLTVDLADPELWQDPYPTWAAARTRHRTARTPTGEPIVLAADDVDVVHSDPAFAQLGLVSLERLGIHDGPFHAWRRLTMAAIDGPEHDRLRSLVVRAFTPRRVEPLRARLRAHAAEMLDAAAARGPVDIVRDYAFDLPLWLICEFLGFPLEARVEISTFLTGTEEGFADPMTPARRQRAEDGIVALSGFVERLVAERLDAPGEDLVSDLLAAEAEGRVDRDELVALVVNVVGGAVGSSRAAIANSVLLMLRHPDQARWVREDRARLRPAVEECLRYHPPFRAGRRKAVVPVDRFGVHLEPGATVYIARQAANRDPDRWNDPDRFDVARPEQRHTSFGYGPHFCLGQAVARLDVQEALAVFLERCDGARLLVDRPRRVPFTTDEQLVELPVELAGR